MNQLHFVPAVFYPFDDALIEGNRRQTGGAGQTFLAGGINRVDTPFVDEYGCAAQRRDRVHDGERAVLARYLCQRLGIRGDTGRGFGVHEGEHPGIRIGFERVFDFLRAHRGAPAVFHHDRDAAAALHILDHAAAEHAVAADDDLFAGTDHIDEAHLHADRTGAGDRKGQRVVRLERVTQQFLEFFHHLDEHRVEVANGRLAHRREHARMNFGGTGSHQMALRRIEGIDLSLRSVILGRHGCPG